MAIRDGPFICFRRRPARRGVTLAEVVVASGLLLVSVVPILKALTSAQVSARIIERKTRSLTLAQSKLDEVRAKAQVNFDQSFAQTSVVLEGSYRGTVSDNGNATLKTVAVSAGFDRDGNGSLAADEVLVTLTTLIAKM